MGGEPADVPRLRAATNNRQPEWRQINFGPCSRAAASRCARPPGPNPGAPGAEHGRKRPPPPPPHRDRQRSSESGPLYVIVGGQRGRPAGSVTTRQLPMMYTCVRRRSQPARRTVAILTADNRVCIIATPDSQ